MIRTYGFAEGGLLNHSYMHDAYGSTSTQYAVGVTNLSELAVLSELRPEDTTLCAAREFLNREDGLPGMEKAYDFEFPTANIVKMEENQIYKATDLGDQCNFGEVFATDRRIKRLDLTVLEDDKQFFP